MLIRVAMLIMLLMLNASVLLLIEWSKQPTEIKNKNDHHAIVWAHCKWNVPWGRLQITACLLERLEGVFLINFEASMTVSAHTNQWKKLATLKSKGAI